MSFLDPNHPIHPEHIPLIISIPFLLGWLWLKFKSKFKKKKKDPKDKPQDK
jgi:hypothetical protein